jgi:hypothetical protein
MDYSGADAGPDGGIGNSLAAPPGTSRPFSERGAVDIGIDDDGGIKSAEHVMETGACPAGLRGGGEAAIVGRAGVDVDRPETGDAERGDPAMTG